nr:MAG TPA: hypothetical protein [Caudoviricetes sp.]
MTCSEREKGGPRKASMLFGERTNTGMNELFALARKRMIWRL